MKDYKFMQQGTERVLDVYLYGEIKSDEVRWSGDVIESKTSANYVKRLIEENNPTQINLYINSVGGSVMEGTAIHNILTRCSATVTVYIDAFAYSVASVIAMAGDKVVMPANTTMMIHNAWLLVAGNAAELRKAADDLDTINEASKESYLKRFKGTPEKLQELLDKETFLTAKQCVEYGLADEIAGTVDVTETQEVVEEAKNNNNPYAKQAVEALNKIIEDKKEPEPTKFEKLEAVLKRRNLI